MKAGEENPVENEVVVAVVEKPKVKAAPTDRIFHDEFLPTFCRRLSFSPKGELLLVPGGLLPKAAAAGGPVSTVENSSSTRKSTSSSASNSTNAVVVFCRHSWTNPCALIPTLGSYSIATKFCPVYFTKRREPYEYGQSFN
jgi:chromatin assembly factor 1 subunit B